MANDALTVKVEFDKENAMNCIKNVLMEEYGMALDELAELCKAKQEGRLREDVQGEWEWFDQERGTPIDGWDREWGWRCSCCKDTLNDEYDDPDSPPKFNFCPNCGARIAGGGER